MESKCILLFKNTKNSSDEFQVQIFCFRWSVVDFFLLWLSFSVSETLFSGWFEGPVQAGAEHDQRHPRQVQVQEMHQRHPGKSKFTSKKVVKSLATTSFKKISTPYATPNFLWISLTKKKSRDFFRQFDCSNPACCGFFFGLVPGS